MAFSMRFARFAKVGPPALILCSGTARAGEQPVGEVAFTEDPLIVLTLAQMQGTIDLGSLIPEQNVLEVVEFEPVSDEELVLWRVLRQYEAIALIAEKVLATDLADAVGPYAAVKTVSAVD